ncbi:MAG: tRNA pseudouridine(55) synthase TruB [Clostridia bacterium]|nr:tRNA pseudouridine(55) synthase TruB [Clostridia bacterium]
MNGYLNVLKPPGVSSAGIVNEIKALTGVRVGHAGTLDPEAAGILPVMVGRATRLLSYFAGSDKEYVAELAFAGSTDTQDAQGTVLEEGRGMPDAEAIQSVLPSFTGEILQTPPAYSALKRDGVPLYKLARRGDTVETEARRVRIDGIDLLSFRADSCLIRVWCGGGTYIRTLCHDIGAALSKPAHMRFLLRSRVGAFSLDGALTMEEVRGAGAEGISALMLPCDFPLQGYRRLDVPPAFQKQAENGVAIPAAFYEGLREGEMYRIYDAKGFLGMAELRGSALKFSVISRGNGD